MMQNAGQAYSQIISSEDYNNIMTNQHLYIKSSDKFILNFIRSKAEKEKLEIIELGCGPARLSVDTANIENINLTAVDLDVNFIKYAKSVLKNANVNIINANVESYFHDKPVDIFYSQGFHHHVEKGYRVQKYLKNIYNQLNSGGYYVLSDEFIPNYDDSEEREIKLVIWYSHVIANAIRNNYLYLAQEEAKTLLDDIYAGRSNINIKTLEQIQLSMDSSIEIENMLRKGNIKEATKKSQLFLQNLEEKFNIEPCTDSTITLSRGDYKICDKVLREEVGPLGFVIEESKVIGPINRIGGMVVYILRKP